MQAYPQPNPIYLALHDIAETCIDEGLPDEAETMVRFLEMVLVSPCTLGLLQVWSLTQRGHMTEALRICEELADKNPQIAQFLPLQAVLRFSARDPRWKAVCEQMLADDATSADARRLAKSLLDGSFGKVNAEGAPAAATSAEPAASQEKIDYAAYNNFMRA